MAGARALTQVVPPTAKIKAILAKLADLPQEAQKEAQTVQELKAELTQLKRHKCEGLDPIKLDAEIQKALAKRDIEWQRRLADKEKLIGTLDDLFTKGRQLCGSLMLKEVSMPTTPLVNPDLPKMPILGKPQLTSPQPPVINNENPVGRPVRAGARRMLHILASRYPMKFTRSQLALFAKLTTKGGTFTAYLSTLKNNGYIQFNGDLLYASPEGIAFVGASSTPPQTTEEVLTMWRSKLRAGARRMFDVVLEHYPATVTKEELAQAIDMEITGGTFTAYLSNLRVNGLVEVTGNEVKASKNLFI